MCSDSGAIFCFGLGQQPENFGGINFDDILSV